MKHIIILIVLLSAFYGAFSQSPINIGIKAGINSSSLIHNIDDFFDQSQVNNYLVGVFARITFSKVYLQPEAYFNAKGGILSSPDPFYSLITEEITYNTIDVPILLGYKLIDKPMFNFRVNIGPVLSWVTTEPMIE
ncbi:MAG TPA: porin family protein, partial [Prolixibacteraceae bacterium]|nr:porin family protein [Prolixibacteraceae bacterium]